MNFFPCEIPNKVNEKIILVIIASFFVLLSAEGYIANFFINSRHIGLISATVLLCISNVAFIATLYFGLDQYKYHIIADVVYFVGMIGGLASVCFTVLTSDLHIEFNMIIAIIFGVIAVGLLISLFTPKLKNWMYLEKSEVNGKAYYVRPKISILAFIEWIFFFVNVLINVLLLVNGILYM